MSILLAVHLPVMMIAGTMLMEQAERKIKGGSGRSSGNILMQVGRNLVRSPLIVGLLAGLVVNLVGIPLPTPIGVAVDGVANIAGPAALISLGMALRQYGLSGNLGIASATSALKLLLLPASVLAASHVLGLSPDWRKALVLTSSVPTGVNAWLIANRFGVGHSLAASTITLTTAFGVLSVSLWAYLLG
jgi:malonate transporter and related proteins